MFADKLLSFFEEVLDAKPFELPNSTEFGEVILELAILLKLVSDFDNYLSLLGSIGENDDFSFIDGRYIVRALPLRVYLFLSHVVMALPRFSGKVTVTHSSMEFITDQGTKVVITSKKDLPDTREVSERLQELMNKV